MKKVKVRKGTKIKEISENLLSTYIAMGWVKIATGTIPSDFSKIK